MSVAENLRAAGVKERPILFSTPMVRAILDGSKTQTRRVVKHGTPFYDVTYAETGEPWALVVGDHGFEPLAPCPFGQVGDRLWVRETFCVATGPTEGEEPTLENSLVHFRADGEIFTGEFSDIRIWKPSIHMPRWASRLTLEITEVRVQRLQDISEDDAGREGCREYFQDLGGARWERMVGQVEAFRDLWDSINAKKHPWESNPWVWALTFEVAA